MKLDLGDFVFVVGVVVVVTLCLGVADRSCDDLPMDGGADGEVLDCVAVAQLLNDLLDRLYRVRDEIEQVHDQAKERCAEIDSLVVGEVVAVEQVLQGQARFEEAP